jgi:hypothetical protein
MRTIIQHLNRLLCWLEKREAKKALKREEALKKEKELKKVKDGLAVYKCNKL